MHEQTHGPLETVPVASLTFAGGADSLLPCANGLCLQRGNIVTWLCGGDGCIVTSCQRRGGFLA